LMAGCGFLLALGPYLKIGTHSTGMPLPYLAMFKFGFVFGQSRFTERFLVYWFLGIAVLAGAGTQRLVSRFKSRGRRVRWVTILVLVIGLDALNSPLTTYVPTIPEPYTVIRELDRTIPVFEEPHNYLANRIWMFNQIRHEHPIMQGHMARRSLESYRWEETNTALDIPRIILNIHHDMDRHPPHSSCLDTLRRRYDWSLLAKDQGMESYLLVLKGEAGS